MLTRSAHATSAISSPANGKTSQKPMSEMGRAIESEATQTLMKN